MTTPKPDAAPPVERITLDDLKHRAGQVKDLAVTETKTAVATALDTNEAKTLMIIAGVVVLAASLAFFLGARSASPRYTIDVDL